MGLFNVLFDIQAKTASFDASLARIESQFLRIGDIATKTGELLGIGFSAQQMLEFTLRSVDAGDAIFRLSQKTGASVESISQLTFAAKESGLGIDGIGTALSRMQKTVSEASTGNYSLAYLFQEIGVNIAVLKNLSPDKQFETIAEAISKIPSPANRAQAAIQIFGRAGADLLPLLVQGATGIDKLKKESDELGTTLTKLSAQQLHDAKLSIDKLEASWSAFGTTLAAKVSPELSGTANLLRKLIGGSTDAEKVADELNQLQAIQKARTFNGQVLGDPIENKKMQDRIKDLLSQQQASVAAAADQGPTQDVKAALTKALGFGPDSLQDVKVSAKRYGITVNEIWEEYYDQLDKDTATSEQKLLLRTREFYFEVGELLKKGLISPGDAASRIKTFNEVNAPLPLEPIVIKSKLLETQVQKTAQAMADAVNTASQTMAQGFEQFFLNPADVGIKGLALDFIKAIEQMIAKQATLSLFGQDSSSGLLGGLFASTFKAISGALAGGGSASAGRSYLVGEQGPEIFTPGASGTVSPNSLLSSSGGGMIQVVQQVDARGATTDAIALLPSAMKQASDNAVSRIVDMRRRGVL